VWLGLIPAMCRFRCRYGSHYSTAVGTVLHYLLRLEPFTAQHVAFQDGHFDVPDRLFFSIPETFNMCMTSLSEVKELIPEFFFLPDMFRNLSGFTLGSTQNGETVVCADCARGWVVQRDGWQELTSPHPMFCFSGTWSCLHGRMGAPKSLFVATEKLWSHHTSLRTSITGLTWCLGTNSKVQKR